MAVRTTRVIWPMTGNARASEGMIMRPIVSSDALAIPICLTTLKTSRATDYVEFRRALSRLSLFS